jgi:DNA-binding CsgD family transcriptional regulator
MLNKRHPGFLDALSQRCPQLTDMQRRICALTRLGMNAAEIGEIIDGGPRDGEEAYDRIERARRNVETHRMRIKKRLDLPAGITLAAFLEGLCSSRDNVPATEQTTERA